MEFYPNVINTCHDCGTPCEGVYAEDEQAAKAGLGKCWDCAGMGEKAQTEPEIDATSGALELAEEAGIDLADTSLASIGRITKSDVQAYLSAQAEDSA